MLSSSDKAAEDSNRLFLSEIQLPEIPNVDSPCQEQEAHLELRRQRFQQAIRELFAEFGQVEEVFVPDRTTKQYAFVRMQSPEEAQKVLLSANTPKLPIPHKLFKAIRPAFSALPRNQVSAKKVQLHQADLEEKEKLALSSNCVVQLHKSHVERVVDFLQGNPYQGQQLVQVMGMTTNKAVAFVFCKTTTNTTPHQFATWLESIWYIRPILHRSFLLDESDSVVRGPNLEPVVSRILDKLTTRLNGMSNNSMAAGVRVRLATFPAGLQTMLLDVVEEKWDTFDGKKEVQFSPTNYTDSLEILEFVPPSPSLQQDGLYGIGFHKQSVNRNTETSSTRVTPNQLASNGNADEICRAYWKLQEATERYSNGVLPPQGGTAIDVGASPGGWTQFLIQDFQCDLVYSIDPGKMDPSIMSLTTKNSDDAIASNKKQRLIVQHLPMIFEKALPEIAQRRTEEFPASQTAVRWYVSDMCVKDVGSQIDALLLAVKLGLVQPRVTFVVLTLKCTTGHSKATFDEMVDRQVTRIQHHLDRVQILHLFANRKSERTVMGYWK